MSLRTKCADSLESLAARLRGESIATKRLRDALARTAEASLDGGITPEWLIAVARCLEVISR